MLSTFRKKNFFTSKISFFLWLNRCTKRVFEVRMREGYFGFVCFVRWILGIVIGCVKLVDTEGEMEVWRKEVSGVSREISFEVAKLKGSGPGNGKSRGFQLRFSKAGSHARDHNYSFPFLVHYSRSGIRLILIPSKFSAKVVFQRRKCHVFRHHIFCF